MSPAVCPACGSPSTYVRKRDGELCCKTCGHGVREENLYYPVPVPDDLPPVDEVQISFDGGKTVWGFVASRLVSGDDE